MKKKYKISTYFKGGRRNMSKKTKMVSYLSLAHIKSSEISHSHIPVMCQYISQVQLRRRNASLTSITTINQNKQNSPPPSCSANAKSVETRARGRQHRYLSLG